MVIGAQSEMATFWDNTHYASIRATEDPCELTNYVYKTKSIRNDNYIKINNATLAYPQMTQINNNAGSDEIFEWLCLSRAIKLKS